MFDLKLRLPDSFDALLPESLREYAPPLRTAIEHFFALLPPERRALVVQDLLRLGVDAPAEEQLVALALHCPTLHKLGQILARDPRLPESLRVLLRELESLPPRRLDPGLRQAIEEQINSALGTVELGELTLAEGSVAAIVPFRWVRAVSGTVQEGVFKVHKPGAVAAIDVELDLWPRVGEVFAHECSELGLAAPASDDLFGRMREVLERETDLITERKNLKIARRRFRRDPEITVPEVLPFGDHRVLAMTRLEGETLGVARATATDGRALAQRVFQTLVLEPLLQARKSALVHGDPHAGNMMLLEDGSLGLLDWSLAASLDKDERVLLVRTVLAGLLLDRERLAKAVAGLAEEVRDESELENAVRVAVRKVHGGRLPGLGWLVELIDDLVMRAAVRFPPNLLVLRKSWVALGGVLIELDPDFRAEALLAREIVRRALFELPRRWVSLPFSRSFSNHLSNLDLLRLATSGPAVLRNFWREAMESNEPLAARPVVRKT